MNLENGKKNAWLYLALHKWWEDQLVVCSAQLRLKEGEKKKKLTGKEKVRT